MGEDQKIIEGIISGQTRLYRILVEKYQQPVFGVILKIVSSEEDAKELTQEVFVKAYESIRQYKPEYKFFSWIYRMAINNALLHNTRKKKLKENMAGIQRFYESAGQNEDHGNRDYLLNRALYELDTNYQSVILLKYYAGLSYPEIAESLGVSEKRVKSRLFDARQLLKKKLSGSEFFSQNSSEYE